MGERRATLILIALVSSLIITLSNVEPVKAQESIVINSDGSIEGTDCIVYNGFNYTLTDNINGTIFVNRTYTIIE